MTNPTVYFVGIDIPTPLRGQWLDRLKVGHVQAVQDCGAYCEEPYTTKLWVDTTKTPEEFDAWVGHLRLDSIGTFQRQNYYKKDGYLWDQFDAVPIGSDLKPVSP